MDGLQMCDIHRGSRKKEREKRKLGRQTQRDCEFSFFKENINKVTEGTIERERERERERDKEREREKEIDGETKREKDREMRKDREREREREKRE